MSDDFLKKEDFYKYMKKFELDLEKRLNHLEKKICVEVTERTSVQLTDKELQQRLKEERQAQRDEDYTNFKKWILLISTITALLTAIGTYIGINGF